jgi:hypothetical protein
VSARCAEDPTWVLRAACSIRWGMMETSLISTRGTTNSRHERSRRRRSTSDDAELLGPRSSRCRVLALSTALVVVAVGLAGCSGHTGRTPGHAVGAAAGAVAAGALSAAERRNRDRRADHEWESAFPPPSLRREPERAALRLVTMPTEDAALAPHQVACRNARDCIPVAGAGCRPVAVRRERAEEVAAARCERPASTYVPRCVRTVCRLESLSPEELESMRLREARGSRP